MNNKNPIPSTNQKPSPPQEDFLFDPGQQNVVNALQDLKDKLLKRRRFWSRAPKGLYIWGAVGRGKTQLMDRFADNLRRAGQFVLRWHFQTFMVFIHKNRSTESSADFESIAKMLYQQTRVLCLDEFQITDIGDAMILKGLFTAIFKRGITLVTTSNTPPGQLYLGGVNRENFLPFLDLLPRFVTPIEITPGEDYRERSSATGQHYLFPLTCNVHAKLETLWRQFAPETIVTTPHVLTVEDRTLPCYRHNGHICWCTFEDLCGQNTGTKDYMAVIESCQVLIISNIPDLQPQHLNQAYRFRDLVDLLYENKRFSVFSAARPIDEFYLHGRQALDFARTRSRLREMQSWKLPPCPPQNT